MGKLDENTRGRLLDLTRAIRHAAVAAILTACVASGDSYIRGHGLAIAKVSPADRAQIVDAAIHAAFDVSPDLILRMYPLDLPRTAGDTGGTPVSPALVNALRDRGLVRGICHPVRSAPKNTPHCSTADAGYIIRSSDVFSISRDTNEIYFAAEKYGPATGVKPEALRFEKAYELVKRAGAWRVVREGRLHER